MVLNSAFLKGAVVNALFYFTASFLKRVVGGKGYNPCGGLSLSLLIL